MSSKIDKVNWFKRHKVLTVLGVLIVIGVIGSAASKPTSNTQTVPGAASGQTNAATTSTAPAEKITITNSTVKEVSYGNEVDGEAKNNDSSKHSATLKATFYDKSGKIIGTAVGALNDVEPGDTKTFTLVGTDTVTGYDHFKVQVDTLL